MENINLMKIGNIEYLCSLESSTVVTVGHTRWHVYNAENVEKAVRAVIERHPKLRINADYTSKCWKYISNPYVAPEIIQAKSQDEWKEIMLEEINQLFKLGDDSSLFKFILIQFGETAQILMKQDHSVGDGTSGMILIDTFLRYYSQIDLLGEEIHVESLPWLPNEDFLFFPNGITEEEEKRIQETKLRMENRLKTWKLCVDAKKNPDPNDRKNYFILKDGTEENFGKIKNICKLKKITINTLITAAYHFVIAKLSSNNWEENPVLKDIYTNLAVNLRKRFNPPLGQVDVGFLISAIPLKHDISIDTDFWEFCQEVHADIYDNLDQNVPFYKNQSYKEVNYDDPEIVENFNKNLGNCLNFTNSNVGAYPFAQVHKLSKGEIVLEKLYGAGAPWAPCFTAYIMLVHSVNYLTYSFTFDYYDGKSEFAKKLSDLIVDFVENSYKIEKLTFQGYLKH